MNSRKRIALVGFVFLLTRAATAGSTDPQESWIVRGSTITVQWGPRPQPNEKAARLWIQQAAIAVGDYYERFPVPTVDIDVGTEEPGQVHNGVTYEGQRITIELGTDTTVKDLNADWTMTHEMLHLALPTLDDDHTWAGEGLSDYIEPIARARDGQLPSQEVWRQLVEGLPKGLPEEGDQGLDGTHTWGRTYWGGALYWFLADLEIRQSTNNQCSVRDALRAIVDHGGNGRSDWSWARVIRTGDQATGTTVLRDLNNRLAHKPFTPDLNNLWKQLGIIDRDGHISYDDHAPLAAIRRSMTER